MTSKVDPGAVMGNLICTFSAIFIYRRLGAKGSYLTLVRVADRILQLRGDDIVFTIRYQLQGLQKNMCSNVAKMYKRSNQQCSEIITQSEFPLYNEK